MLERLPPFLPGRGREDLHRHPLAAQDQQIPLASDRRSGLADRDQKISAAHQIGSGVRKRSSDATTKNKEGRLRRQTLRRVLHAGGDPRDRQLRRRAPYRGDSRNRDARARAGGADRLSVARLHGRSLCRMDPLGHQRRRLPAAARRRRSNSSRKCSRRCSRCSPRSYIHIGGDECPKGRWKACPLCQHAHPRGGAQGRIPVCRATSSTASNAGCIPTAGRSSVGTKSSRAAFRKPRNIMSWNGSDPGIKAAQREHPGDYDAEMVLLLAITARPPTRSVNEPLGNTRYVSVATGLPASTLRRGSRCPTRETDQGRAVQPLDGVHRGHPPRTAHGPAAHGGSRRRRAGPTTARITTISCAGFRRWSPSTRPKATTTPPICSRASNDARQRFRSRTNPQVTTCGVFFHAPSAAKPGHAPDAAMGTSARESGYFSDT